MDEQPVAPLTWSASEVFDYSALPPDISLPLQERAERIMQAGRRSVEAMGDIGRELIGAQDTLEHGLFLKWVEALGISKSAAYRAMDVARNLGEKLPKLGSLPLTVVQQIASKATPEAAREAIVERIDAGEPLAPAAILEFVHGAQEEAKRSAALAKLSPHERKQLEAKQGRQRRSKEQRAAEWERRHDELAAEKARQQSAAGQAVALVEEALGEDFGRFAGFVEDAGWWFTSAVRERAAVRGLGATSGKA